MTRFFKEPLLHFVLGGAALFLLYAIVGPDASEGKHEIVVDSGQLSVIENRFTRTWQRPPTPAEREALITDHVLAEVYYREALALGIDADDEVIRRRLRQKMQFLLEDTLSLLTPQEEELQAYYAANADQFVTEPRYSFAQVFVSSDRSASALSARIKALAAQLAAGTEVTGDRSLLQLRYEDESAFQVNRVFGQQFAAQLDELSLNDWRGPLRSGLGLHFVRLGERVAPRLPALAEIREQVVQAWTEQKRRRMTDDVNQRLLAKYEVIIEPTPATGG